MLFRSAWSGRPQHANDRNRSIPPETLSRLASLDCSFVSLHQKHTDRDIAWLSSEPSILHFSQELTDFADTAALVSALDLVITVDTAIAHLAGALGKPVWIMLPYIAPDWRWLLNRIDSPWYPSATLFRQSAPDTWPDVIAEVATRLKVFSRPK